MKSQGPLGSARIRGCVLIPRTQLIQAYIALFLGIQQRFTIYAIKILKTIIQSN